MSGSIYRFGRFRLDPRSRELWAGDDLVGMPPKSFECLAYLIEHRERAVGRDELISAVWGSSEVSDHSLAQTLLRARQVLGDTGADRTMIRTVPRFGHRWVAPTEVVVAQAVATPARNVVVRPVDDAIEPVDAVVAVPVVARRQMLRMTLAVLLPCFAVMLGYHQWHRQAGAPESSVPAASAPSAAEELFVVMPVNLADDTIETAWVRLGAMDYIATLLHKNAKRHVLPSDQVVSVVGASGRAEPRDGNNLGWLRAVTGASWIIIPRATSSGQDWQFTLDVYHDGGMRSYEGSDSAPLPASRRAVIALMADLGVPDADAPQSPLPADELLQRVDAALLVGDLTQARTLIETAPEQTRNDPRFRTRAGNVALRQGRSDEAEGFYRPLATDDAAIPVPVRAAAYMGLGAVTVYRLDFATAENAYDKAIALLKGSDEVRLLGRAYMGRGAVYVSRSEFGRAMADFGQARIDLQRAGDRIGTANLEINVGMAEVNRGRVEQGIAAFDRAIPILTSFGARDQLVISLHNKTYAQLELLDVPGALATSQRAMELVDQLANQAFVRRLGAARGRALFAAGKLRELAALFPRFDAHPEDPAHSDTEFAVLRTLLLTERRDYAAVEAQGDAIVARVEHSADQTGQALLSEASWLVIDAALRVGRIEHAERVLRRLRAAPPAAEDLNRSVIGQLAQAQIAQARKDAGATQAFAAALATADERGAPEPIILVATTWLPHLLAAGDLERAASVIGRLATHVERDYRSARSTAILYRALGRTALATEAEAKARQLAGERDPEIRDSGKGQPAPH